MLSGMLRGAVVGRGEKVEEEAVRGGMRIGKRTRISVRGRGRGCRIHEFLAFFQRQWDAFGLCRGRKGRGERGLLG